MPQSPRPASCRSRRWLPVGSECDFLFARFVAGFDFDDAVHFLTFAIAISEALITESPLSPLTFEHDVALVAAAHFSGAGTFDAYVGIGISASTSRRESMMSSVERTRPSVFLSLSVSLSVAWFTLLRPGFAAGGDVVAFEFRNAPDASFR